MWKKRPPERYFFEKLKLWQIAQISVTRHKRGNSAAIRRHSASSPSMSD
jgi:hypothetical protein